MKALKKTEACYKVKVGNGQYEVVTYLPGQGWHHSHAKPLCVADEDVRQQRVLWDFKEQDWIWD